VLSPAGLVDLAAVLPFWFALVLPADFRFVLVFRMVRFFKIARYSPAMRSLLDVLYRERRALIGCLVITLGMSLVAAALMHLAEGQVQPEKLGTIPDAFWWAIVTVGTIGYGDVVPVIALRRTNLLVLSAQDLHALMKRDPRIAARVKDVVEKRTGRKVADSEE
jgi:voltage-gated potassium channel